MSRPGRRGVRRLAPRNLADTFGDSSRSPTVIRMDSWRIRSLTNTPPGFKPLGVSSEVSRTVAPVIVHPDGAVRSVSSARSSEPRDAEVPPASRTGQVLECRVDTGLARSRRVEALEIHLRDRRAKVVVSRERMSDSGYFRRDVVEREVEVHPLAVMSAILAHENRDGTIVLSAPLNGPECHCCFRGVAGADPLTQHSEDTTRPQDRWCQMEGIRRLASDSFGTRLENLQCT